MTPAELDRSARNDESPPAELSEALRALWFSRAGRWHESHDVAQDMPDPEGAWIHAHLHREEGDLGNARYWYARAKRDAPPQSLGIEAEWNELATHFTSL